MIKYWPHPSEPQVEQPAGEEKAQTDFYIALAHDLSVDNNIVRGERDDLLDETKNLNSLANWEFRYLDDDLGTTHIEKKIDWIFEDDEPSEARKKYEHLFPEDADYEFQNRHRIEEEEEEKRRKEYFDIRNTQKKSRHVMARLSREKKGPRKDDLEYCGDGRVKQIEGDKFTDWTEHIPPPS